MVAESTEILRPIDQLGWAQACSGVTAVICALVRRRNGPPEAVKMMRRTPGAMLPPGKHWKIALCSLSIGNTLALPALQAAPKTSPAITRASLLASRIFFPALAAAKAGSRPA